MRKRKKLLTRVLALVLAITLVIPEQAAYAQPRAGESSAGTNAIHIFHKYEWVTTKEATCRSTGLKEKKCSCGKVKETEVIPKASHQYSVKWERVESTCKDAGHQINKCRWYYLGCTATTGSSLPLKEHNYSKWITTKTPFCYPGEEKNYCSVCGTPSGKTRELAPTTSHKFDKFIGVSGSDRVFQCSNSRCTEKTRVPNNPSGGSGSGSGGSSGSGSGNGGSSGSGSGNGGSSGSGSGNGGSSGSGSGNGGSSGSGSGSGNSSVNTQNNTPKEKEATNVTKTEKSDPVNLFLGAHDINFTVMSQGGASKITIGLNYESDVTCKGIFGFGFSWNYESFYEEIPEGIKLYHSPSEFVLYSFDESKGYYTTNVVGSELDRLSKKSDKSVILKSKGKTFNYDNNGKLVKVAEKTGESVSIEYKDNEIDLIDDISGQIIKLFLNENGYVNKVSNNASAEAYFEYDDNGYLIKFTDVDGFITSYTYDEAGRVLTGTDSDGNVYFIDEYNDEGKIVKQKDALGNEAFFEYLDNEDGTKQTVFTDRTGMITKYTFDKAGRLLSETNALGNTESSKYDSMGNCISKNNAIGNSISMEYDERHNLVKATDEAENVTLYEYDDNDNLIKITFADGSKATFAYDSKNRLVSTVDARGLETFNQYDKNGYLIRTIIGNRSIAYTYEKGNVKTVTDAMGNVTTFTYDENGHKAETKDANGAVTKSTVSPYGSVLDVTDALGNVTVSTYNCVDKPLTSIDAEGNVVICKYDERQLLAETIDAKGNSTKYYYDNEERLVKTVYADGSYTENTYDSIGRMVKSNDAEGNSTEYFYDAAGNVIKETDKNGSVCTYTYTKTNKVASKTDANGNTTTYAYDNRNRLITETYPNGGVVTSTYNAAGDVLTVTDPWGNVTSYEYDEYGQRTKTTDPNGNITTYVYDLNGNLIKTTDALGETVVYKYDSGNRLLATKVNADVKVNFPDIDIPEVIEEEDEEEEYYNVLVASKKINHVHYGTSGLTSPSGCYNEPYSSYEKTGTTTREEVWDLCCGNCGQGPKAHFAGNPYGACDNFTAKVVTKTEDVYGYVTRYKCIHEDELTGEVKVYLCKNTLSVDVRYTDGKEYPVSSYSWKYGSTSVSSEPTCEVTESGTYILTVTVKDKYSGVNQSYTVSYNATYIPPKAENKKGEDIAKQFEEFALKWNSEESAIVTANGTGNITHVHYGTNGATSPSGCYNEPYSSYEKTGTTTREEVWDLCCGNCGEGPKAHFAGNPYGACDNFTAKVVTKTEDVYGYVTRYKCSHGGETTGKIEIYPSGSNLAAKVIYANGEEYPVTAYSWKYGGTVVSTGSTCLVGDSGLYTLTVTVKDKYSGVNQSFSAACDAKYNITATASSKKNDDGSVSVNMSSFGKTSEWSMDGGATWQTGNVFTIDKNGTYIFAGKNAKGEIARKALTVNNAETDNENGTFVYLSGMKGVGSATADSGDIDISGHKYLDITTINCAVSIDGEVKYDYSGANANDEEVTKRFDIADAKTLRITAKSESLATFNSNVANILRLELIDAEIETPVDESVGIFEIPTGKQVAVTAYEYDLKGQLIAVTDPNGNRSTKEYDKRGNVVKITDALGNATVYSYDENSNLISTTNAKNQTTTYTVNNLNQVTSVTDALGFITSYAYDNNGRMNSSTNPLGGVSTNIFDKNGNILSVTGPEGGTTSFKYDANGNILSKSTIEDNSVKYTYNATNLVQSLTNAREQITTYEYDLCGRVVKASFAEGDVLYTYDANGNVLTVTDNNGTVKRTYDALNRVTSITDTNGNTVGYEYDELGNLKTLTYPDGTSVSYTYDLCGNIKTVTDFEGKVTEYSYDALNREVETRNANGTRLVKEYDAISKLIRMAEYKLSDDALLSETLYDYDDDNRLVKETETVKKYAYEYTYDDLGRVLKRTTKNSDTNEITYEETFSMDGAGNITSATDSEGSKSLTYNNKDNRIVSLNDSTFAFDNDGNLVAGTLNGVNSSLSYDSRNRLIAYDNSTFTYDSEDYRIKQSKEEKVYTNMDVTGQIASYTNSSDYSEYKGFTAKQNANSSGKVVKYPNEYDDWSGRCMIECLDYGVQVGNDWVDIRDGSWIRIDNHYQGFLYVDHFELFVKMTDDIILEDTQYVLSLWEWDSRSNVFSHVPMSYARGKEISASSLNNDGDIVFKSSDITSQEYGFYFELDSCSIASLGTKELHFQLEEGNKASDSYYDPQDSIETYPFIEIDFQDHKYFDSLALDFNYMKSGDIRLETFDGNSLLSSYDIKRLSGNEIISFESKPFDKVRIIVLKGDPFTKTEIKKLAFGKGLQPTVSDENIIINDTTSLYSNNSIKVDRSTIASQIIKKEAIENNESDYTNKYYDENTEILNRLTQGENVETQENVESDALEDEKSEGESAVSENNNAEAVYGDLSENNAIPSDAVEIELIAEPAETVTDTIESTTEDVESTEGEETEVVDENSIEEDIDEEIITSDAEDVSGNHSLPEMFEVTGKRDLEVDLSIIKSNDRPSLDLNAVCINSSSTFDDSDAVTYTIAYSTSYCYDRENKNLLVTTDSDGTIVKYVYGNGLIASYETVADTTEYQSYSYDIRGSVTRISDENGIATSEYLYSTYGQRTVLYGTGASILGYCGRDGVLTDATGLLYMRARYYSTELMRFINEDIIVGDISNSGSLNRYTYVEGNPVTNVDPFGLCAEDSLWARAKNKVVDFWDENKETIITATVAVAGVAVLATLMPYALPVILGAVSGAVINGGMEIYEQKKLLNQENLDWNKIVTACSFGALSGALSGSNAGLLLSTLGNAAINAGDTAMDFVIDCSRGEEFDGTDFALKVTSSAVVGGITGAIGGSGAQKGIYKVSEYRYIMNDAVNVTEKYVAYGTFQAAEKVAMKEALYGMAKSAEYSACIEAFNAASSPNTVE